MIKFIRERELVKANMEKTVALQLEHVLHKSIIAEYTFDSKGALTYFRTVDDDLAGRLGLGPDVDTYDGLMRLLCEIVPGPFDVQKVEQIQSAGHGIVKLMYGHSDAEGLDNLLDYETPVSGATIMLPELKRHAMSNANLTITQERVEHPPFGKDYNPDQTIVRIMHDVDFYTRRLKLYAHSETPDRNTIWADANHHPESNVIRASFR